MFVLPILTLGCGLPIMFQLSVSPPILGNIIMNPSNTDTDRHEITVSELGGLISPSLSKTDHVGAQTISLVFAVDHRMLIPLAVAINSTLFHSRNPDRLHIHIMLPRDKPLPKDTDLDSYFKTVLAGRSAKLEVHLVDVSHIVAKMRVNFHGYGPSKDYLKSELNYVRFELQSLLPNVSKVIYLDPDVVVQADVEELWETALPHGSKFALAAVQRRRSSHWFGNPTFKGMLNFKDPQIAQLFAPDELYFNAGVFVANLDKWRELDLSTRMVRWLSINAERNIYQFGSQPPMNMVFYRDYQKLPDEWNRPMGTSGGGDAELKEGRTNDDLYVQSGKILHWSGNRKPWVKGQGRYAKVWHRYIHDTEKIGQFTTVNV